ncbi:MAG: hypothetical protein M5T52_23770 [Ignavibacteriaceae bacterium]|nr:hypothetical protein [Ignavibacteriaceae bacterium]
MGHILDSICSKNYVSSPSWGSNNNIVVSVEGNLSIVNISNDSLTQLTSSYQDFSYFGQKMEIILHILNLFAILTAVLLFII